MAHQAPLSMEFLRQPTGVDCHFLLLAGRHLPNPGIEPKSPALTGRFFTTESPGKPSVEHTSTIESTSEKENADFSTQGPLFYILISPNIRMSIRHYLGKNRFISLNIYYSSLIFSKPLAFTRFQVSL